MKKSVITTIISIVLMAFAVSAVSAAAVEKTDVELVEGITESYKIEVPAAMTAFLVENGISEDLVASYDRDADGAKALSRAIDELKQTELDEDADEDDATLNEQFNSIVGRALWSAYNAGFDPVYMDVGTLRYVWTTPVDDDTDDDA